eukprot:9481379-Lingulodinium_polyedra.AAC.1
MQVGAVAVSVVYRPPLDWAVRGARRDGSFRGRGRGSDCGRRVARPRERAAAGVDVCPSNPAQ